MQMKRRYVVDSIVQEYKTKRKYEKKVEIQQFQKKHCLYCKNKKTDKCEIRRDIDGKLKCVYNEL